MISVALLRTSLALTLILGQWISQYPVDRRNFWILGLITLVALGLQALWFGTRFIIPQRGPSRIKDVLGFIEPGEKEMIFYGGSEYESGKDQKDAKEILRGVMNPKTQLLLRIASVLLAGLYIVFVANDKASLSLSTGVHLLSICLLIPAIDMNHWILPLCINVALTVMSLAHMEHAPNGALAAYAIALMATLISHRYAEWEAQRGLELETTKERLRKWALIQTLKNGAIFLGIAVFLNWVLPDPRSWIDPKELPAPSPSALFPMPKPGEQTGPDQSSFTPRPQPVAADEGPRIIPETVPSLAPSGTAAFEATPPPAPQIPEPQPPELPAGAAPLQTGSTAQVQIPPPPPPSGQSQGPAGPMQQAQALPPAAGGQNPPAASHSGSDPEGLQAGSNELASSQPSTTQAQAHGENNAHPEQPGPPGNVDTDASDGSGAMKAGSDPAGGGVPSPAEGKAQALGATQNPDAGEESKTFLEKLTELKDRFKDEAKKLGKLLDFKLDEPTKRLLQSLMKLSLILGSTILVLGFLSRLSRKPRPAENKSKPKKVKLDPEQKSELLSELQRLGLAKLELRDEVIQKYQLFLKTFEAAGKPKPTHLPATDFDSEAQSAFPKLKEPIHSISETFCDVYSGNLPQDEKRIARFRESLEKVVRSFLRD